mmetsp:Transcript_1696/g.3495  ORF Transcript_1696/g.3495 Transcript_1696/m.3495 type:complete len:264 (+) Transcript_1696:221-1012(+)
MALLTTSLHNLAVAAAVASVPCFGRIHTTRLVLLVALCCALLSSIGVSAFSSPISVCKDYHVTNQITAHHGQFTSSRMKNSSTKLCNLFPKDDFEKDDFDDDDDTDIDYALKAQLSKAKALLRDAKKKLEAKQKAEQKRLEAVAAGTEAEASQEESPLPFFATRSFTSSASETSRKIKKTTPKGIVADGDTMAALSKSEPWERRSLNQMFKNENKLEDETSAATKSLVDKDVAMSIYNLRKTLQNEDFKRVFDSRNRFIGEID